MVRGAGFENPGTTTAPEPETLDVIDISKLKKAQG
jgi:hypothetical protein